MPASTHTAFNCAPFISSVDRASSSKLRSVSRIRPFILLGDPLDTLVIQLSRMNLQDSLSGTLIRQRELNLPVQST